MKFLSKSYIFIQENEFEIVICKMAAIVSHSQCVKYVSFTVLKRSLEVTPSSNSCPGCISEDALKMIDKDEQEFQQENVIMQVRLFKDQQGAMKIKRVASAAPDFQISCKDLTT